MIVHIIQDHCKVGKKGGKSENWLLKVSAQELHMVWSHFIDQSKPHSYI